MVSDGCTVPELLHVSLQQFSAFGQVLHQDLLHGTHAIHVDLTHRGEGIGGTEMMGRGFTNDGLLMVNHGKNADTFISLMGI